MMDWKKRTLAARRHTGHHLGPIRATCALILLAMNMLPAEAGSIRHDTNDSEYLEIASDLAYDAVGRITWSQEGQGFLSGGALIASDWVLTAAHVVDGIDLNGGGISQLIFRINNRNYGAVDWFPHPDYRDESESGFDLGLIQLTRDVSGVIPAELYRSQDELGQTVALVGYGATGHGLSGIVPDSAGVRRGGNNVVDVVGSATPIGLAEPYFETENLMAIDFDSPINPFDSAFGERDSLPLEILPVFGDSGTPALVQDGDTTVVMGVTSEIRSLDGTVNGVYGDVATFVRVSQFAAWIDAMIASPIDLPGDYNGNGLVDAPDYNVWRDSFAEIGASAADGNDNGVVDLADYNIWRDNFSASASNSVPEPTTVAGLLAASAIPWLFPRQLRPRITKRRRAVECNFA